MISVGTVFKCSDNSGAILIKCIKIYKRKKKGSIGDNVLGVVVTYNPKKKLKKGEMHKVLIIRTKYRSKVNNSYYRFSDNAGIILNKKNMPIATRLFGCSTRLMRLYNRKVFLLLPYII